MNIYPQENDPEFVAFLNGLRRTKSRSPLERDRKLVKRMLSGWNPYPNYPYPLIHGNRDENKYWKGIDLGVTNAPDDVAFPDFSKLKNLMDEFYPEKKADDFEEFRVRYLGERSLVMGQNITLAKRFIEIGEENGHIQDGMDVLAEILSNILEYPVEISYDEIYMHIVVEYGPQDNYGYTKGMIMGWPLDRFRGVTTAEEVLEAIGKPAKQLGRIIYGRLVEGKPLEYTGRDRIL